MSSFFSCLWNLRNYSIRKSWTHISCQTPYVHKAWSNLSFSIASSKDILRNWVKENTSFAIITLMIINQEFILSISVNIKVLHWVGTSNLIINYFLIQKISWSFFKLVDRNLLVPKFSCEYYKRVVKAIYIS